MKLLVKLALGLVLLLLVAGIGAGLFIDSLVEAAIERGGMHALGVETRLESADIGLFSGEFALDGLAVANPPGFAAPDFCALRSSRLVLPLSTLMEPTVTIPSLTLTGITLDLERNAQGTNYGVILDNLARLESGPAEPGPGEPASGGAKTFLLQSLVIRDVRATVNLLPTGGDLTKLSLAVPEIVVEGLGTEMTLAQICALVVKTVVRAAVQAGGNVLPPELLADLRGRLDVFEGQARARVGEQLDTVKGALQEQARNLGPEAEKALRQASDELGGKLDGLLKKKD